LPYGLGYLVRPCALNSLAARAAGISFKNIRRINRTAANSIPFTLRQDLLGFNGIMERSRKRYSSKTGGTSSLFGISVWNSEYAYFIPYHADIVFAVPASKKQRRPQITKVRTAGFRKLHALSKGSCRRTPYGTVHNAA
jgi:hypothetical protein